jgi:hypothetical protein
LLVELEKQFDSFPNSYIGKVFKEFGPYFKAYTTYVNNYDKAFEAYEQYAKKKKSFQEFLEARYKELPRGAHKIDSYLIMPVQSKYKIKKEYQGLNIFNIDIECY